VCLAGLKKENYNISNGVLCRSDKILAPIKLGYEVWQMLNED
jgi:hypothetical protein